MTRNVIASNRRALTLLVGIVVLSCCFGCDSDQPEIPSRWISISVADGQDSAGGLTVADFDRIKATIPTLERAAALRPPTEPPIEEANLPSPLSQIWVKVGELHEVDQTIEVLKATLKQSHPDVQFTIQSQVPEDVEEISSE